MKISTAITLLGLAAAALLPSAAAADLPVGLEIKSGIGVGRFAMGDLNEYIALKRQETGANFRELTSGFNFFAEGRVWLFGRAAGLAGFEHYWAEAALPTVAGTINFKAPADVLYLGGAVNAFSFPDFIDINAGIRGTFAKSVYGTNEADMARFVEYKANSYGWDIFVETSTNFIRPLEVGFTLGYRRLNIDGFQDKFGRSAVFSSSGVPVSLDYSGMFFYFTAGVAIR